MTYVSPCARYAAFFEAMTPETLGQLRNLCVPNIRFKDPFNDFRGVEEMIAIFEKMYEEVADPSFRILHVCEEAENGFIHWEFTGHTKKGSGNYYIEGVSLVCFDGEARMVSHQDFWDPAHTIYEKVPLLGILLRFIRQRLSLITDS